MARKFAAEHRIRFLTNDEDVPFGPDNNPKRKGSKAADQFAKYRDGMTIAEAYEAGLTTAELTYDVEHNYITVVAGEETAAA